jgi:hypothetical protein
MAAKTWLIAVEWTHDGVQDVDEVKVLARTEPEAIAAARAAWRSRLANTWPGIRIRRVFAITPEMVGGV